MTELLALLAVAVLATTLATLGGVVLLARRCARVLGRLEGRAGSGEVAGRHAGEGHDAAAAAPGVLSEAATTAG
jgi:hypothetical protein